MFTHAGASRRRLHAGAGLLLALTGLLGGCAARVVDLQRITISARPADGPVEALGFHGDVSASGFTGEQLVYEVTVLDRDGDPLLSRDGRYQNRAGHVAAGKTVMVWQDVATFENLTVTLPLREVPADQGGRAVWARFAVYDRAGRMLAEREMPFLMPKRDYAAEMTRSGPPRNAVPGAGSQPPATAMGPVMPTGRGVWTARTPPHRTRPTPCARPRMPVHWRRIRQMRENQQIIYGIVGGEIPRPAPGRWTSPGPLMIERPQQRHAEPCPQAVSPHEVGRQAD